MSAEAPLIVHVVYRFSVGGLENGVVNLVNRLPRGAWRHAIVSLTEIDSTFAERIADPGVELLALRKPPGHGWRLYPQLVRLFRKLRPAIVHTRNLAALEVTPAAWAARVPARLHGEHGRDAVDPGGSQPAAPARPSAVPAVRHALRRLVAGPRSVPARRDRCRTGSHRANLQWCRL